MSKRKRSSITSDRNETRTHPEETIGADIRKTHTMRGKTMTPQDVAMDQHRDAASVTNTGTDMTNAQTRQTHKTLKHAETTIEIMQIKKTETEIVIAKETKLTTVQKIRGKYQHSVIMLDTFCFNSLIFLSFSSDLSNCCSLAPYSKLLRRFAGEDDDGATLFAYDGVDLFKFLKQVIQTQPKSVEKRCFVRMSLLLVPYVCIMCNICTRRREINK